MHIKHLEKMQHKIQNQTTDFYTSRGLHVYFKDSLQNDSIDFDSVISKVESLLPSHLTSEVEMLVVGQFDEFEENDFNAFYDSGAIYVSNIQDDVDDMVDDIVHEYAHSLEEPYGMQLYSDNKIKNEFLNKRRYLHNLLWKMDIKAPKSFFVDVDYNKEFDEFLYKKIGYDKLNEICRGLFISPYAATSLREYYATGFTDFFMYRDGHEYLKNISPELYKKIFELYSEDNLDF